VGDSEASGVRLQVQGSFGLGSPSGALAVAPSSQRLLAFLALRNGLAGRGVVARNLWPGTDDDRAAASLRTAVWRARAIGAALIETTRTQLRLAPGIGVDMWETVGLAKRVLDPAIELDDAELQIGPFCRGELLPDWDEPWIIRERERVRDLVLNALEQLSSRLLARCRFGEAIEAAHAAIRVDPLRESAHRQLLRAHLAAGNMGEVAAFRVGAPSPPGQSADASRAGTGSPRMGWSRIGCWRR
jgi:DNA-binding SARP family transcriptional activator